MRKLLSCFYKKDPLIIEGLKEIENGCHENIKKSETLMKAVMAVKDMHFQGSILSFHTWSQGNFQTLFTFIKCKIRQAIFGEYSYDKRESFTFKDGGKINIDYKGKRFKENLTDQEDNFKPLIVVAVGFLSNSQSGYVTDIVKHLVHGDSQNDKECKETSFDVAVINYRGQAQMKLYNHKIFTFNSQEDLHEPLEFIYKKYCEPNKIKIYALGLSMGGNALTNILGKQKEQTYIQGACIVSAPFQLHEVYDHIQKYNNGFYDLAFGRQMKSFLLANHLQLSSKFSQNGDLDIVKILEKEDRIIQIDNKILSKLMDYDNNREFLQKSSCFNSIPNIRTPTLFIHSKDDPVYGPNVVNYEVFKQNKSTILATTETGGHLGYHQSIFQSQIWISNPILKFFNALR